MIKLENSWADMIETMESNFSDCPYEGSAIIAMFLRKWLEDKCPEEYPWIVETLKSRFLQ